ncbi:hypothetical protein [Breoghania sp. L-A4]|uniref:hypothetical protein n=1 Tax=Breoghania sp. L-A4 TaxID=2304600 RepID=UPI0032048071
MRASARRAGRSAIADALASCRAAFWGVGAISLVINLLMLTGPLFMLQVYDRVLTSRSVPTLVVLAALTGMLFLFFGLLETVRGRSLTRIGQTLDVRLSGNSYAAGSSLALALGRKGERLEPVRDLELLRQFLSSAGPRRSSTCRGCRSIWRSSSSFIRCSAGWRSAAA